ncbi:MAG: NAD-dependent epimerase/dehydratase family protein [Candidatus Methanospirareceae archaeon]
METRKILVTGGAGFMGSWIVDKLVEEGYEVYDIDNLSGGNRENVNDEATNYILDLADKGATEEVVRRVKPEVLFHLAACAREGASQFQPQKVTETNFYAYMNVLEPCIKYGLEKCIVFSSMAVYGDQKPPFDETMPRRPVDIYGMNKAAMEQATEVLSEVHEFDYVICRPHNVFGEKQGFTSRGCDRYRNVVCIFMNEIMRGDPLTIFGDGEQMRAFSYIEDSLPCYIRCLDDDIRNEIINIGGMHPITINKLADIVCEAMGVDPKTYPREYLPPRPREVKYAWCTWEKSVKLLGYEEKIGYEEGIRRMAKWVKSKGPQPWIEEKLPLQGKKTPSIWKKE